MAFPCPGEVTWGVPLNGGASFAAVDPESSVGLRSQTGDRSKARASKGWVDPKDLGVLAAIREDLEMAMCLAVCVLRVVCFCKAP